MNELIKDDGLGCGGGKTQNRLGHAALEYASMGFQVLPCVPNGKNPATKHGFHDAVSNPADVQAVWTRNPNFNIGIRTGTELNGKVLVVIDIDPRNGGNTTLAELLAIYGALPDTARVTTGRRDGGLHYYFWCPPEVNLKSKLGQGIDVKSRGGYVIAPPSIHPDTGLSYEWAASHDLFKGMAIAALPQWIVDRCSLDFPLITNLSAQGVASGISIDDDTYRDLRSALLSMRADDRVLWVRMGLALSELGDVGRGIWMQWSSQSDKFDPRDAAQTWESFK